MLCLRVGCLVFDCVVLCFGVYFTVRVLGFYVVIVIEYVNAVVLMNTGCGLVV